MVDEDDEDDTSGIDMKIIQFRFIVTANLAEKRFSFIIIIRRSSSLPSSSAPPYNGSIECEIASGCDGLNIDLKIFANVTLYWSVRANY